MEKKPNARQKLALERMWRLFELAEKAHAEGKEERTKRYLGLAKRIGEKTNTSLPKEIKVRFCKKCFSMKVQAKEEKPFLVVKCGECGFAKRYGLGEKRPAERKAKAGEAKGPAPKAKKAKTKK